MVQKKMGGVATGTSRRENRNKMMKSHMQGENKRVVGSMESLGSLSNFMGVTPITNDAVQDYYSVRQALD